MNKIPNPPLHNRELKLALRYLPYFGGKRKPDLGSWLFRNFDLDGIKNYVEPFSGMFGIYFGEFSDFSNVENIIYNDIDLQNCNVMSCAQMPAPFLTEIHNSFNDPEGVFYYTGLSEEEIFEKYKELYIEYHKAKKVLPNVPVKTRDFNTAVMYSFLRLHSMKSMHFLTVGPKNKYNENWYKRYKLLQPLVNKLSDHKFVSKASRIDVNSVDFEKIMIRYNNPESFIYLDPPYYDREKLYDAEEKDVFTKSDHERLAKAINNSKARIALSYYYFDGIELLYPRNKFRYEIRTFYNSAAQKPEDELLILNYDRNAKQSYFYKHDDIYFQENNSIYELITPSDYDIIYSLPSNKQIEYTDDDKRTIIAIKINKNRIYIGNSLKEAISNIDYLRPLVEAEFYRM